MNAEADDLIPTRNSLLLRLKDWKDQKSWRRFFDTYGGLIYRSAIRCGLTDTEAQEVLQETVIGVAKKMPEFTYDPAKDSFKGWLLYLTRKQVAAQFRLRDRLRGGPQGGAPISGATAWETLPDPSGFELEAVWDREWQKHLFEAALARVKQQVHPKQFQIFSFYILKEWPVADVTRALGVSAAQVYLAKHRLGAVLKRELRKLEQELSGRRANR